MTKLEMKSWFLKRIEEVIDNTEKCTEMHITINWSSGEVPSIRYEIDEVVWENVPRSEVE